MNLSQTHPSQEVGFESFLKQKQTEKTCFNKKALRVTVLVNF